MVKKQFSFEKILEFTLFISMLLAFLDSYEFQSFPLSWLGNLLIVIICLIIFIKEKIKINSLLLLLVSIALLPTIFNLFSLTNSFNDLLYTITRVLSFIGFVFTVVVISKSKYKKIVFKSLKNVFYLIFLISIYTYIAQLFNFYEPVRNRPGTGILGFDIQTNFWISESHRMIGTFREPVFLVSILFPSYLVLHYKSLNGFYFYFISGVLFGLTKSELALIMTLFFVILDFVLKKGFDLKTVLFTASFSVCFFVPVYECNISPSNYECPQNLVNEENSFSEEVVEFQASSPKDFEYQNRERLDSISFFLNNLNENTGYGYQVTNAIYTNYLATEVNSEMYLTNRTLPEYLSVRYLSKSFGSGRYFLTYENINLQNNFMFNLFSIGMIYFVAMFLAILYFLINNKEHGFKVALILISISLASIEDLLPIYGLYLSLVFTLERNES